MKMSELDDAVLKALRDDKEVSVTSPEDLKAIIHLVDDLSTAIVGVQAKIITRASGISTSLMNKIIKLLVQINKDVHKIKRETLLEMLDENEKVQLDPFGV
jgi:hypothetical protein